MEYFFGAGTNIGPKKSTNQDSYLVKIAHYKDKDIAMAILCDGMGGLDRGELASAFIVNEFSEWFDKEITKILDDRDIIENIAKQWKRKLEELNYRLMEYGKRNSVTLGSTITGIIIINGRFLIVNVGDSRTYMINSIINQITEDQSLVAREVRMGRMSSIEAELDPRRSVLLQCLGAVKNIDVEFYMGQAIPEDEFLLCSDGFRHKISNEEILDKLHPSKMKDESCIDNAIDELINLNLNRLETDNITAILIKAM